MVDWTDKRVGRLKLLFKEGYSASAIAESSVSVWLTSRTQSCPSPLRSNTGAYRRTREFCTRPLGQWAVFGGRDTIDLSDGALHQQLGAADEFGESG
jgi:hypothetical protein